jgi:hypothetical protein
LARDVRDTSRTIVTQRRGSGEASGTATERLFPPAAVRVAVASRETTASDPPSEYRPGACNIGRSQRRSRALKAAAAFAVAGGIVAAHFLEYLPSEPLVATVFVPLVLACEWAIQAYDSVCVRLAMLGRYDFRTDGGSGGGGAGEVPGEADRRKDGVRAAKITAVSVLIAGVVTLGLVLAV